MTTTPNMGLPVPVPGTTSGPDWATQQVAQASIIDEHDHSSGKGVVVTPSGMSINADLSFGGNNAYQIKSVRFTAQSAPLSGGSDVGCLYESGVDLYYNDGNGNQIRVTSGGSVAGSTGTITGLPSGTAGAAYSAGTFTFISATSTPAVMSVGPIKISRNAASPKGVTIAASASQAADYNITLFTALPVAGAFVIVDSAGALTSQGGTGSGNVVQATSPTITTPTFSGVPLGTITSSTYTPTTGASSGSISSANGFVYQRIGNMVTVWGHVAGAANGAGTAVYVFSLPINPTNNFVNTYDLLGVAAPVSTGGTAPTTIFIQAATSTKSAQFTITGLGASAPVTAQLNFTYSCA